MNGKLLRICGRAALGAAVWLAAEGLAGAQTWTSPDPAAKPWVDAKVNVGPIYFNPTFDLKNVGLDDNVFNDTSFARRDFTGTLEMRSLMGVHFGDTLVFSAVQDTQYVYYRRYRSERSVDGALGGILELRTPVFRPYVKMDSTHTHDRQGLEIDSRAGRQLPTLEFGTDILLGRLSVAVAYHRQKIIFASGEEFLKVDLEKALDQTTVQYRGLVRWQATDLMNFVGGSDIIKDTFPNNPLNNSRSQYYYGGVETKGDALIVGTLFVGYKIQKHDDASVASFKGVSTQGDLTFIPQERMKIEVSVDRDPQYSYDSAYAYYVQQGGGVTLTERLAARFDTILSAKSDWLNYHDLIAGTNAPRTDRDVVFGIGAGYFMGGQNGSRYGITVERAERVSPIEGRSYHTYRFLSNVRLSF